MAKQTFTVGQVLTAAQMTSLQQTAMGGGSATAKTASYVLLASDAGSTIIMNSASSTTITVNTALFAAGDTVLIVNQGAGVCTVTAGTATVSTAGSLALAQYETGILYFLSTSAAIFSDYTQTAGTNKVVGMTNTQTGSVATGTTTIPQDNTIPQITEGDQYMTLSYTPTSATNKLQIDAVAFGASSANCSMVMALFQDSTANALAATTQYMVGGPTNNYSQILRHTMTSGTTSAIAFKIRIGLDNAGTFTFNGRGGSQLFGGVAASSITITEYTP